MNPKPLLVALTILTLLLPTAAARYPFAVEVCSHGGCSGWGAEYHATYQSVNFSPYQGQNSDCSRSVIIVGFAVLGNSQTCSGNNTYVCEACNASTGPIRSVVASAKVPR